MSTIACIDAHASIPSLPASFIRPRYGAIYCAPTERAVTAWCTLYTAVNVTGTSSLTSRRAVWMPSMVIGTLTTTLVSSSARSRALEYISATVSPQACSCSSSTSSSNASLDICRMLGRVHFTPSRLRIVGLVVNPKNIPVSAHFLH